MSYVLDLHLDIEIKLLNKDENIWGTVEWASAAEGARKEYQIPSLYIAS